MTTTEIPMAPVTLRLDGVLPDVELAILEPLVEEIEQLKKDRNAVVLAHNYMTPDIFHGVADLRGDSLQLARLAADTDADVIVMAGVHFMAETAKIVNPSKTVLIPDMDAGCSLAESITAADIRLPRVGRDDHRVRGGRLRAPVGRRGGSKDAPDSRRSVA